MVLNHYCVCSVTNISFVVYFGFEPFYYMRCDQLPFWNFMVLSFLLCLAICIFFVCLFVCFSSFLRVIIIIIIIIIIIVIIIIINLKTGLQKMLIGED